MRGVSLLSMPTGGKSTIGKLAANRLDWKFTDLDAHIAAVRGKTHAEILREDGTEVLLRVERDETLLLPLENTVFAPGGSIVYSPEALAKMEHATTVLHLRWPFAEIERRLRALLPGRGVVGLEGRTLRELYDERTAISEAWAHRTLDCDGLDVPQTLERVLAVLQELREDLRALLAE